MANRRQFLAGLLAAGAMPQPTWADAKNPTYLSAAGVPNGDYALFGLDHIGDILFQIPLPARGHAAAAHPRRPEAVAFARRPGTFALVIDCSKGLFSVRLDAPEGRHFYGHGVFSADGQWLFTTENDYESGEGRIGVWDASRDYKRVDEFSSGGVGPHDIKLIPNTQTLVVANGGIETHPDSGRTKLNIPTMESNLAYIQDGEVVEVAQLAPEYHKNSIRHLAVADNGQVALGMQWQGQDSFPPALVGLHTRSEEIKLLPTSDPVPLRGYVGSITFSNDQNTVAVTSPRGGTVQMFNAIDGAPTRTVRISDVCGISADSAGLIVTDGLGRILTISDELPVLRHTHPSKWDNHLVKVG